MGSSGNGNRVNGRVGQDRTIIFPDEKRVLPFTSWSQVQTAIFVHRRDKRHVPRTVQGKSRCQEEDRFLFDQQTMRVMMPYCEP